MDLHLINLNYNLIRKTIFIMYIGQFITYVKDL